MKAKLITSNFASLTSTKTQSEKSYRKITPNFTAQSLAKELSRFWATFLTLVSTLSMVMALFQKIKVTCNSQRQSI
jgi:flagellar basal body rod protein FlgC